MRAEKDASLIAKPTNEEEEVLYKAIAKTNKEKPGWYAKARRQHQGVTEETTTGVHRLYQMERDGRLLWPAINVNDSVTKSKVRQSLRLPRIAGRRHPPRHRRHDVGQGGDVAASATSAKARPLAAPGRLRVKVSEVDPICALQAAMEGYEVVTMEDAAPRPTSSSPPRQCRRADARPHAAR